MHSFIYFISYSFVCIYPSILVFYLSESKVRCKAVCHFLSKTLHLFTRWGVCAAADKAVGGTSGGAVAATNNKMAAGSLAAWNVSELSVRPLRKGGGGRAVFPRSWPRLHLFWLLFTQPAACVRPETIARKLPERQRTRRPKWAEYSLRNKAFKRKRFGKKRSGGE